MPLPQGRKPLDKSCFARNIMPFPEITRVEIIDSTGRAYTQYNVAEVQMSIQDDGRTMKIFLKNEEKTND